MTMQQPPIEEPRGCDHFRGRLERVGYTIGIGHTSDGNECNWYAYKRSEVDARACELNRDKPGAQIVVRPWQHVINGETRRSAVMSVGGEYETVWYEMTARSHNITLIMANLDAIERELVAAWNVIATI